MGIYTSLLMDFTNAFNVSDIIGILAQQKAGMMAFDLAVGMLLLLSLPLGLDLRFR